MRRLALASTAVCVLALGGARPAEAGLGKREFAQAAASPDSHFRYHQFLKLDPDDKGERKLLMAVIGGQSGKYASWHDREAGIAALARATSEDAVEDIVKELDRDRNYLVRQGLCAVVAQKGGDQFWEPLVKALTEDKDPRVRREAANALAQFRKKETVGALIEHWKEEEDPLVHNFIRSSLEALTKRYHGPDPQPWDDWWKAVHDEFVMGSTDEEAEKLAEEEGNKAKEGTTQARDVNIGFVERGAGTPLLVIPPYGYAKEVIMPFMTELEKRNKIFYIDLPPISEFKNLAPGAGGMPYYPIDKMVEAFEEIRKERKLGRFAVMAWGFNSWMALRYASKYPQAVSHVVLVAPVSGDQEYGRASQRMITDGEKSGDIELWHLGLSRSINGQSGKSTHDEFHEQKQLAYPDGEREAIARKEWTVRFANQHDRISAHYFPLRERQLGGVLIPQFSVTAEPELRCPVMIIVGKHTIYASIPDCKTIQKHYGAILQVYPGSADMPHIEESERFNKDLAKFLSRGR